MSRSSVIATLTDTPAKQTHAHGRARLPARPRSSLGSVTSGVGLFHGTGGVAQMTPRQEKLSNQSLEKFIGKKSYFGLDFLVIEI
jgi:hypothetical protein